MWDTLVYNNPYSPLSSSSIASSLQVSIYLYIMVTIKGGLVYACIHGYQKSTSMLILKNLSMDIKFVITFKHWTCMLGGWEVWSYRITPLSPPRNSVNFKFASFNLIHIYVEPVHRWVHGINNLTTIMVSKNLPTGIDILVFGGHLQLGESSVLLD